MKVPIDAERGDYGVEPLCKVLPIARSPDYFHAAGQAGSTLQPACWSCDRPLKEPIQRVWQANCQVDGAHTGWHALRDQHIQNTLGFSRGGSV